MRSFQITDRFRSTTAGMIAMLVLFCIGCAGNPQPALAGDEFADPGPYFVGWMNVKVSRGGSGTIDAILYYPATVVGENAPFDASGGPYPGISFGHGFLSSVSLYESTLQHLATWGYFAIASKSQGGLFPNHERFAEDLRFCLDFLEIENDDPQSIFFQAVDVGSFGLSGHSMGGGCSMLAAAQEGSRLRGVCNLAAAETNPSAIAASANITAPISLLSGSDDSITPLAQHGQRMFDSAVAARLLPVIRGGFHCGFIDEAIIFCDSGSISRDEQLRLTRRYMTAFFNLYLKGDENAWYDVWGPGAILNPAMDVDVQPGASIEPFVQSKRAPAGEILTYEIDVTNTGPSANSFSLFAHGSRWKIQITPQQTQALEPGEREAVTVRVLVGASGSSRNVAMISARSDVDNLTRAVSGVISQRTN